MKENMISQKLKKFIELNKMSQIDIAYCADVPPSSVSNLLYNKSRNEYYDGFILDFISGKSETSLRRYRKLMKRKEVGRRLKENRLSKNISMTEIMFRLDVIHRVISDIESGRFDITTSNTNSKKMRELYFEKNIITREEYKEIANTKKFKPEPIISVNNSLS